MSQNYNIDDLIKSAKSGGAEEIFSRLSPSDAANIKSILANKKLTEQLINSPQAQQIIKSIMGDKK